MPSEITSSDIVAGLRNLGVTEGDVVFVHASLSRFGHVFGGADAVIDALQEAVGAAGTLAMPGFTFQLVGKQAPVFDVLNARPWAGAIYERFRVRENPHRSHHFSHSVLATGARARELTADHGPYPCQAPSPFAKLPEWGAKILFLGVSHNSSTTLQAVEEMENVPYMGFREVEGARIIDEEGRRRALPSFEHSLSRSYDFNRLEPALEAAGAQRKALIGDALVRCVDARLMWDVAVNAVRRDPHALALEGERKLEIPVCRGDLEDVAETAPPTE